MNTEKEAFSKRLREAVRSAGHDPRPAVLERLFNTRYPGRSVTFQAVSGWLGGRSIPSQDKLQVLAELLEVEPHYLRFGEGAMKAIREKHARWDAGLAPQDRELVEAVLALTTEQKKVIRDVIRAFGLKPARK